MSFKNLNTNEIFNILNSLKQNIGLAVCDFTDNQTIRNKAITTMESRFNQIIDVINKYFDDKKVKNILKISVQLKQDSDISYWNNKKHLETLKIDFAHKFDIPLKCIEVNIDYKQEVY